AGGPGQSEADAGYHPDAAPGQFTPQRPRELRRGPARMPRVEDFPIVGQREYRAKHGHDGVDGDGANRFGAGARIGSLFGRLTSLGSWQNDSQTDESHTSEEYRHNTDDRHGFTADSDLPAGPHASRSDFRRRS